MKTFLWFCRLLQWLPGVLAWEACPFLSKSPKQQCYKSYENLKIKNMTHIKQNTISHNCKYHWPYPYSLNVWLSIKIIFDPLLNLLHKQQWANLLEKDHQTLPSFQMLWDHFFTPTFPSIRRQTLLNLAIKLQVTRGLDLLFHLYLKV